MLDGFSGTFGRGEFQLRVAARFVAIPSRGLEPSWQPLDGSLEMILDKPFSFGSETHYPIQYELKPGEQLVTSCTRDNDNNFGVPFGESTDSEMCYQFTWSYPAHALSTALRACPACQTRAGDLISIVRAAHDVGCEPLAC
jgi:hypothetical protein